jgi:spore coat polysaccharide biosynthesis protein SpsF
MKILAISQARLGSTRLAGKILKEVGGRTMLSRHIERIQRSELIDQLIVATTISPLDNVLESILKEMGIACFRGDENNVLDRFYQAALSYNPDYVVRLTSDCPLIDPTVIDSVIAFALKTGCDYVSNTLEPSFPDGQDVEIFTFPALTKAWKEAGLLSEKEHVTPYIWKNSSLKGGTLFTSANYKAERDFSSVRITLDEQSDLLVLQQLIQALGDNAGWKEYAEYYMSHPDIRRHNETIERNAGFKNSELNEKNN